MLKKNSFCVPPKNKNKNTRQISLEQYESEYILTVSFKHPFKSLDKTFYGTSDMSEMYDTVINRHQ